MLDLTLDNWYDEVIAYELADLNRRTTERTTVTRIANAFLAGSYACDGFALQQELQAAATTF